MVQMGPKGSQMLGLWSIIQTTHKDKLKQFGVAQSLKVETLVLVSHWRRRSARTSSICHFRQTEQYKYVWMCVRSSSCVRASETNGKWIQQRPCDMAAAEKQMHSMEWQSAKAKANKQINNWAQYMPDLEGKSESKVIGPRFKFTPRFHRPHTSGNLPKVRCRQFKGGGDDKHTRTSEWHPSYTIFCLNFFSQLYWRLSA